MLICAGLVLAFAGAHVHDWDASLYAVLIRHLAADGQLFRLHFLPSMWPEFYEHPPFYFWVCALFAKLFGEGNMPWLNGLFGIGTLLLTYAWARMIASARVALTAMFVLGITESFFRYQARTRVDVLFTLLITAAPYALVRRKYLLGSILCVCAFLTKGPPAIVAPAIALIWITVEDRRIPWRQILLCAALIAAPIAALLWADVRFNEARWWTHYVHEQVLSSLSGASDRADTSFTWRSMPMNVLMRFWPGLAFVPLAFLRRGQLREKLVLLAWAALIVIGYSLPARGFWWYVVPAFVPLSVLAAFGADPLVARLERFAVMLWPLAALSLLSALLVWPRLILPPCPLGDLPARADALTPMGQTIGFLTLPGENLEVLAPSHVHRIIRYDLLESNVAIVENALLPPDGWSEVARNGRFVLLVRR